MLVTIIKVIPVLIAALIVGNSVFSNTRLGIAASLVAEVFPKKARAMAGGIFHASSVMGAVLAAGVGMYLDKATDWRPAFLIGLLPGLLVVWVLVSLKESEKWEATRAGGSDDAKPKPKGGSLRELLGPGPWRSRALRRGSFGLCRRPAE